MFVKFSPSPEAFRALAKSLRRFQFRPIRFVNAFHAMANIEGFRDDDNVTIYLREEEGHVSLVHLEPNYFSAFCSKEEDAEEVLALFESLLPWRGDEVFTLAHVQENLDAGIRSLCFKYGKMLSESVCDLFVFESEADLDQKYKLPEIIADGNVETRALSRGEGHMDFILGKWPHARHYYRWQLLASFDSGLCQGTFVGGELVSWVCVMRHGMLVMLHTLEGHRRKGHAKSCVAAAAKRMLSMGLKPMAGSAVGNDVSFSFFSGLGFKRSHGTSWFVYSPPATDGEGKKAAESFS